MSINTRNDQQFGDSNIFSDSRVYLQKPQQCLDGWQFKIVYLNNLQKYMELGMMVLVDGTVHGDSYITPIVIVCKLCKWFTL